MAPKIGTTKNLKIHSCVLANDDEYLNIYGSDRRHIENLCKKHPELTQKLHSDFPYTEAEVVWSIRNEMAETVEDILSRRLRILFIDAAIEMSKKVSSILAKELGADKNWEKNQLEIFNTLANGYI